MEKIRAMISAELISADRGHRPPRGGTMDLVALLALGEWGTAAQVLRDDAGLIVPSGGVLHLMAKRNDVTAVKWLLDHGADPNGCWPHWDADSPHYTWRLSRDTRRSCACCWQPRGDPRIRDSKHHGDAAGWAEYFQQPEIVRILENHTAPS